MIKTKDQYDFYHDDNLTLWCVQDGHGLIFWSKCTWAHMWVFICNWKSIQIWTDVWLTCILQTTWNVNWCNELWCQNTTTRIFYIKLSYLSTCQYKLHINLVKPLADNISWCCFDYQDKMRESFKKYPLKKWPDSWRL